MPLIDWQFFFHAWDLKGKFPAILEQPAARELYDDALAELERDRPRRIAAGRAASTASGRRTPRATTSSLDGTRFCFLRQQAAQQRRPAEPLPRRLRRARRTTTLGAFAVCDPRRRRARGRASQREHDDYRAIIVKALADRLAEAFAEWLHRRARREWYAPDEQLSRRGAARASASAASGRPSATRPAPITARRTKLFDLLGAGDVGLELTESFAMTPAAAVSGIYLAHPRRAVLRGRAGSGATSSRTTRVVKENPCYKSSGGCDQISRSLRAAGPVLSRPSRGRRTRRQSHRQDSTRRSGVGVAALLRPADFGARLARRRDEADEADHATACPGFDPKESDLVVTGHANANFAFQQRGRAGLDQTRRCSRARRRVRTDFARTISAGARRLPRLPAEEGARTSSAVEVERHRLPADRHASAPPTAATITVQDGHGHG